MKNIYYRAQNTGFTSGISWFDMYEETHYRTYKDAKLVVERFQKRHPEIKTRILKVTEEVEILS